jgi:hypothetical protein
MYDRVCYEDRQEISELSISEILTRVSMYANELRKRMIQAGPLEIFEVRDRILKDD